MTEYNIITNLIIAIGGMIAIQTTISNKYKTFYNNMYSDIPTNIPTVIVAKENILNMMNEYIIIGTSACDTMDNTESKLFCKFYNVTAKMLQDANTLQETKIVLERICFMIGYKALSQFNILTASTFLIGIDLENLKTSMFRVLEQKPLNWTDINQVFTLLENRQAKLMLPIANRYIEDYGVSIAV